MSDRKTKVNPIATNNGETMKTIEIKTQENPILWKNSHPPVLTPYTLNAGPKNLLLAIQVAKGIRKEQVTKHGGVGAGSTWIEIGGIEVEHGDLQWIQDLIDARLDGPRKNIPTGMEGARAVLARYDHG